MRAFARLLHRAALWAYPLSFHAEFGREVARVFDERLDRAPSRRAGAALALFLIADALISGLAERARSRQERWAWPRHSLPSPNRSRLMSWESLRADARLAFRQFRRAPLFAALTIASLALGIGANSAMFGVVRAVLLEPLPYADPGALVTIWSDNTKAGEKDNPVSPANYHAFKAAPSLAGVEGMYSFVTPAQVRIDAEPEPVIVSQVTPSMLSLLGRAPVLGRKFDDPGVSDGAVLSYQYWQRRFGGDPAVIGRRMAVTGAGAAAAVPILGVMPEDFTFPYGSMLGASGFTRSVVVDMWWPISSTRDWRLVDQTGQPNRSIHYFGIVGRLAPGASIERATADLKAIAAQRAADYPDTNTGWGVTVRPLHEQAVGRLRPTLLILLAGVGVVLLITCINVANVLLARAAGRGRDQAIRSALGASRSRLMQQALVESVLLSFAGGIAGLAVMVVATRGIIAAAPADLPRLSEVSPDATVALFAVVLSLATGLAVGLLPAISAANSMAQDSLRDGTRATASRARRKTRAALIVTEVALAMTLTVCGGLLLRSFVSVLSVDPGFKAEQLLTLQVAVPARHETPEARLTFYDELEARLRALPGVVNVGGTTRLPLGSTQVTTSLEVEGRTVLPAERPEVEMRRALFDYFSTMQIPLLRGRSFTRNDTATTPLVTVVNAALADRVFPGEEAVGRRIRFGASWMTIIGVVGNIKHGSLEEIPKPELYVSYRQGPPVGPYLVIRTQQDAVALTGAVRQAVRELGADPPTDIRTMEAIKSRSVASRRFVLLLVGLFGVLALGLAALGVFGVITLIAEERTTEVGIRLALGATPSQVLHLVIGHALKLALGGIAIGTAIALALGPLLESQLFGVRPMDPLTYAAVALALVVTTVVGALLPARRAMRVDPVHALRAT